MGLGRLGYSRARWAACRRGKGKLGWASFRRKFLVPAHGHIINRKAFEISKSFFYKANQI
jgi:hypothetical protein